MSAHRILGLNSVLLVWLFATKAWYELGSERRDSSVPICCGRRNIERSCP